MATTNESPSLPTTPSKRLRWASVGAALVLVVLLCGRWLFYPPEALFPDPPVAEAQRVHPAHVGFAIVKTARMYVRQGFVFDGGDFEKVLENDFSAFLVKHDDSYFLFDTGLGRNIEAQYRRDMAVWKRMSFKYESPVSPARDQLDLAGIRIDRVFVSHSHWDHVAAVEDFSEADVWVTKPELDLIHRGGAWESQVGSQAIKWRTLDLDGGAYEGFEHSHDLFGDGSVVFVPLYGHTAGAMGMFVTVDSGKRFFFCGDAVWNAAAIPEARPRPRLARSIADEDPAAAEGVLKQLRDLGARHPDLVVIPAHDGAVQRALGYFPAWVR